MKVKKYFSFVAVLVFVISVILLISLTNKESASNNTLEVPKIKFKKRNSSAFEISLSENVNLSIPDSLPLYELSSSSFSEDDSKIFAKTLGFSNDPERLVDSEFGTILVWIENNKYLNIRPSMGIIDYKNNQINTALIPNFIDEDTLIEVAKQFVAKSGLVNSENNLYVKNLEYFSTDIDDYESVSKEEADSVVVTLEQTINSYPIVNNTYDVGEISVGLKKDGGVSSLYLEKTGEAEEFSKIKIKDISQIKDSLNDAEIQSFPDSKISGINFLRTKVNNIIVEDIYIAYLNQYSTNQLYLQPIFVLTGTAATEDKGKVSIVLYLPAAI